MEHQVEVITRRTENRLKKARHREHILEGRIKALDVIDEIIKLIRASDDVATARDGLMSGTLRILRDSGERHLGHAASSADPAVED